MSDRRLSDTPITFDPERGIRYSVIVDGLNKNEVLCRINRDENPLNEDGSLKEGYIKDEFDIEIQLGNNFETITTKKVVNYYKIVKKIPDGSGFSSYRAIFSYGDSPCSYPEKKFEEIYIKTDNPLESNSFFYKREVPPDFGSDRGGNITFTRYRATAPFVRDDNTDPRSPGRGLETWVNFPDIDPDNFYKVLNIPNPNRSTEVGAGDNFLFYADPQTTISCNSNIVDNRVYPITVFISNIGLDGNRNQKLMCGSLDDNEEEELSKFVKELTVYVNQDPQDSNFTISDKVLYSSDGNSPIPISEFMINTPQGTVMANSIKAYGVEELYYTISEFQFSSGDNPSVYKRVSESPSGVCNRTSSADANRIPNPNLTGCRLVNSRLNPYNLKTTVCDGKEYRWDESQSYWKPERRVNFRI